MYNIAPLWEEFTFEETKSTVDNSECLWGSWVLHCVFLWFTGFSVLCLNFCFWFAFGLSSAGIPSMRRLAAREIISDCVDLSDTRVCFLHIQRKVTNVWLPNMHSACPTWSRFRIFEISRKVRVLKLSQTTLMCCVSHMTYCQYSLVKCMWEMKRAKRLSLALVHFVIARASLLTDHRISGLPMRAKHKHFRTIREHTSDNSPTDFNSPQDKEWILSTTAKVFLFANFTIAFPHTFWHDLPCRRTTWKSPMFPRLVVFPENSWIQTWLCNCQQYLCSCRVVFECSPSVRDQGTMSVLPNQLLYWVLPHWTKILFLSSQFDVIRKYS